MKKFRNKYRTKSHRRPNWNYSDNGLYYITLVTQGRECNLGEIINMEMILSEFGKIVKNEWMKSFDIRRELLLDEYIIMPNHIHAIVVIDVPVCSGDSVLNGDQDEIGVPNHPESMKPGDANQSPSDGEDVIVEKCYTTCKS